VEIVTHGGCGVGVSGVSPSRLVDTDGSTCHTRRMNTPAFRKTYVAYLRSATIAAVLAVTVTVVRAQYVLWMDF
jgi:hypothetical protein